MKKTVNDIIKNFEEEVKDAVSETRPLWEGTKEDDIYNVDIHIWRKPGMGNSLQTISGNRLSIMTALTSFLHTLMYKEIFTKKDLEFILEVASKDAKDL